MDEKPTVHTSPTARQRASEIKKYRCKNLIAVLETHPI